MSTNPNYLGPFRNRFSRNLYRKLPLVNSLSLNQSETVFQIKFWSTTFWTYGQTIWLAWGGYGLLFRSEFFFRTTRELEYLFFLSHKAQIFFPESNIRLYDKNSESDFFFLHQNQNIFFSNIGNQNIFFRKKT
jgi:hypothetical protein